MKNKIYNIGGMSCDHCVKAVEMELKELELNSFAVSIGKVEAEFDEEKISSQNIIDAIHEAGYKVIE